tara:strand:+ start:423 stop:1361 length:939 start_codon:yes stop_codon:yes gene_type:complete
MISKYKITNIRECCISENDKTNIYQLINSHNVNLIIAGNPGTGKTTLINLIVEEYYKDCKNARENILNINSLQEQGIQYYRTDVKNFCQIKSSIPGLKKTIVVDNIDEIGEQQQQIFQNYIDNFDINFIATTNNISKVNHNIISRVNYIELLLITKKNLIDLYNKVYIEENMKNQLETIPKELIIELSGYSYKKLLNNIFKIKLYGKPCSCEEIIKMCSNINIQYYESFITNIINKNYTESLNILYSASTNEGYSIQDILFYFYYYVKTHQKICDNFKYELIKIITKYIALIINNSDDDLELALFTYECINI